MTSHYDDDGVFHITPSATTPAGQMQTFINAGLFESASREPFVWQEPAVEVSGTTKGFQMSNMDIDHRFDYHPPTTDEKKTAHEAVRAKCKEIAHFLDLALEEGREKSLSITKLEEVMFWANASIARNA